MAEIRLSAAVRDQRLIVAVNDDGAGIQFKSLKVRGRALGLPCETSDDLVELLFTDGVSAVDTVSDVSGRGIGMAALRDEVRRSSGHVTVESTLGEGTRFVFELPVRADPSLWAGSA